MSVDGLFVDASSIAPHSVPGVLTGVDLAGIDGIILLATIFVLVVVVIARPRSKPREASKPSRDEFFNAQEQARSATSIHADVAPPLSDGAPQARTSSVPDEITVPGVGPRPIPHQAARTRFGLHMLPDRIVHFLRLRSVPGAASALVTGLILVWIGQSMLLRADPGIGTYAVWLVGLVLLALVVDQSDLGQAVSEAPAATDACERLSGKRGAVLFSVGITSIYIWQEAHDRAATNASLDLVLLWLGSIAALVVAATGLPRREHASRLRAWVKRVRADILITVGVVFVALIPRVYDLSSFPWAMSGDEGTFAVTARNVLRGELSNPFTSGPWGYPSLLFIFQAWLIELTGDTVGGARMLSALLGTASVVAIYWLARHHFGRWVGLAAAALSTAFHFHLFWSRDAQNAIAPMFFIPLTLIFLDRGLIERRRTDSLAAGLVIGLAQFFHPANRILFPLVHCARLFDGEAGVG